MGSEAEDIPKLFLLAQVALAALAAAVSAAAEEASMAVAVAVASVADLVVAAEASGAVIATLVVLVVTVAIETDSRPETRHLALVALTDATVTATVGSTAVVTAAALVVTVVATVVALVVTAAVTVATVAAASTIGAETAIIVIVTVTVIMTEATDHPAMAVDSAIATVVAVLEATTNQLVVDARVGIASGKEISTAPGMTTTESEDMRAEATRIPERSADTKLPQIFRQLLRFGAACNASLFGRRGVSLIPACCNSMVMREGKRSFLSCSIMSFLSCI